MQKNHGRPYLRHYFLDEFPNALLHRSKKDPPIKYPIPLYPIRSFPIIPVIVGYNLHPTLVFWSEWLPFQSPRTAFA